MKKLLSVQLFFSFLICCILPVSNLAAAEFSGDFIIQKDKARQMIKVFVKGEKRRHEVYNEGKLQNIAIFDPQGGQLINVMVKEKMYMKLPLSQEMKKMISEGGDRKKLGEPVATETIDGYQCDKYIDKTPEGTTTVWMARTLKFPLRIEAVANDGSRTLMTYENIQEKKLGDDLFTVPEGYREFQMPKMPGGMQFPNMPRQHE